MTPFQGNNLKYTVIYCLWCLFFKQEEVEKLHAHVEKVIKENKGLQEEIAKSVGLRQADW